MTRTTTRTPSSIRSSRRPRPGLLSDSELLGAASAARRQQAHAEWQELRAVAEFARRQEERYAASKDRGERRLHREGEFGAEELAFELGVSRQAARQRIDLATGLDTRLPRTFAGLRDGTITAEKARIIHARTCYLTDEHAAIADEVLADAAPGLRPQSLHAKAVKVSHALDPDAGQREKDDAARRRRVEVRQEDSGNAVIAGRELDSTEALTARAGIWEEAARLRRLGMDGTLDEIRARIYLDRLRGIDTAARLGPAPQPRPPATGPDSAEDHEDGTPAGGGAVPAAITILIPAATLLGTSDTMAEAAGFGLLDAEDARALIRNASSHPRTRWCITVIGESGEAVAHGCARGQHPWKAPPPGSTGRLADLLRGLNITLEPIARGTCDHRHQEDQYRPSRKLRHLATARTGTCPAPGCGARASHNELDHTIPWPHGATDECNLSPPCARHHHAKHAPGWNLHQPQPGHLTWTTPSGRIYHTRPTTYDL